MNTKGNLALAVLAGISIGAVSVMAVHAQEAKTPPAYLIAETDVTDRAAFQKYAEKVPETLAPFRGSFHYVVRGGKTQALEGQPPKSTVCARSTAPRKLSPGITRLPMRPSSRSGRGLR